MRFRPEVSEAEKIAVVESRGARRKRQLRGSSRVERLEPTGGQTPQMLAAQLAGQASVAWAEPNYLITRAELTPNDPRFTEQRALRNQGSHQGADIAAPAAWEKTTGATQTLIAVIDSGIDFTHPDLANNQWVNAVERTNARDDDHDGYVDALHGWDRVAGGNQIRGAARLGAGSEPRRRGDHQLCRDEKPDVGDARSIIAHRNFVAGDIAGLPRV